ncbi:hypothetical protein [Breoghania sp.]|uniref:hypothetical protein n=1 Tax=Breoghania sp. TaxID=2065378 RepID=UPI002AAB3B0A|nr:hypothetical protein [Breoghania sp.]
MKRISVNAPNQTAFLVSLILVGIGLIDAVTTVIVLPIAPLWLIAIGYLVLALACYSRRF